MQSETYARKLGFSEKATNATEDELEPGIQKLINKYFETFTARMKQGTNIIFTGVAGSGKTSVLACIAKRLTTIDDDEIFKGYYRGDDFRNHVNYFKFYDICKILADTDLANKAERDSAICKMENGVILFIDDFDTNVQNKRVLIELQHIVEMRYTKQLPTFITTTLTKENLAANEDFTNIYDKLRANGVFTIIKRKSIRDDEERAANEWL